MKIKTIFKINIALIFLQGLPLFISLFSPEFKMMLLGDVFGNNPSDDAIMMFDQFALVLGLVIIGIIALIYGSLSFNDINVLRRLSLLYFALAGFFLNSSYFLLISALVKLYEPSLSENLYFFSSFGGVGVEVVVVVVGGV